MTTYEINRNNRFCENDTSPYGLYQKILQLEESNNKTISSFIRDNVYKICLSDSIAYCVYRDFNQHLDQSTSKIIYNSIKAKVLKNEIIGFKKTGFKKNLESSLS